MDRQIADRRRPGGDRRRELLPGRLRGPSTGIRLDRAAGWVAGRADRPGHRSHVRPGPGDGRGAGARSGPGSSSSAAARRGWRGVRDDLVAVHGEDRFPIVVADMGSLASVRAAVDAVLATESRLDVLVDNAGAIFPERTIGPDGIEATLAIMVVGPFVLVVGPAAAARADGRRRGSSPSRRAACTRRRSTSTTSSGRRGAVLRAARLCPREAGPGRARAGVGAPAARRPDATASRSTRCTRAGRTRPASPSSCPAFYDVDAARSCARPPRASDTIVWLATDPRPRATRRRAVPGPAAAAVRPPPERPA